MHTHISLSLSIYIYIYIYQGCHGTARARWHGLVGHSTARLRMPRLEMARHGTAAYGTVALGTARHGLARHGHGTARRFMNKAFELGTRIHDLGVQIRDVSPRPQLQVQR